MGGGVYRVSWVIFILGFWLCLFISSFRDFGFSFGLVSVFFRGFRLI